MTLSLTDGGLDDCSSFQRKGWVSFVYGFSSFFFSQSIEHSIFFMVYVCVSMTGDSSDRKAGQIDNQALPALTQGLLPWISSLVLIRPWWTKSFTASDCAHGTALCRAVFFRTYDFKGLLPVRDPGTQEVRCPNQLLEFKVSLQNLSAFQEVHPAGRWLTIQLPVCRVTLGTRIIWPALLHRDNLGLLAALLFFCLSFTCLPSFYSPLYFHLKLLLRMPVSKTMHLGAYYFIA